jgi:hypothetical protein
VMASTEYVPPHVEHKGFTYVGSIQTACKAIDRADDIDGLTEKSKLVLRREPTNKYDKNAIQIVATEFLYTGGLRVTTSSADSGNGADGGASGISVRASVAPCPSAGYLPARLCDKIAEHVDDTRNVVVDCIMLGKPHNGLSKEYATWFDVQLDFFLIDALAKSEQFKLAAKLQAIRDGAPSSVT